MNGIEAITANNGWSMALTGISIVLAGISILALIISQIHKIMAFFEPRQEPSAMPTRRVKPDFGAFDAELFKDIDTVARLCHPLVTELGPQFELPKLYELFKVEDVPHPHLTIRSLREGGYLVPTGDGAFVWKAG